MLQGSTPRRNDKANPEGLHQRMCPLSPQRAEGIPAASEMIAVRVGHGQARWR